MKGSKKIILPLGVIILVGIVSTLLSAYFIVDILDSKPSSMIPLSLNTISDDDNEDYPISIELKFHDPLNPSEGESEEDDNEDPDPIDFQLYRNIWYEIQITAIFDYDKDILAHLRIVFEGIADPMPQLGLNDIEVLIKGPGYESYITLENWDFFPENNKALMGESLDWMYYSEHKPQKEKYKIKFRLLPSFPGDYLTMYFQMFGMDAPGD